MSIINTGQLEIIGKNMTDQVKALLYRWYYIFYICRDPDLDYPIEKRLLCEYELIIQEKPLIMAAKIYYHYD